jgi:DNA-binding MltR family transcriptional regulator
MNDIKKQEGAMSDISRNDEVMKYCFGDDAEFVAVKHYERLQRELAEAQTTLQFAKKEYHALFREFSILVKQRDMLAIGLRKLIELDDKMRDPDYDESGTYAGAYYCYYKGECDTWEGARAALAAVKGGDA